MSEPTEKPTSSSGPAWVPAATRDWPTYFDRVAGGEPRETLLEALNAFERDAPPDALRHAIDLGCGEGRDTAELLRRGWSVLAIDAHPDAFRRLVSRPDLVNTDRLTMQMRAFESLHALPQADLINASFALPFCPPHSFQILWSAIRGSIAPGGWFSGQFFGDRDSWATIRDRSHFTRSQARNLLKGLDVVRFDEDEKDGSDASGNQKHWHVFHVVARASKTPHRESEPRR